MLSKGIGLGSPVQRAIGPSGQLHGGGNGKPSCVVVRLVPEGLGSPRMGQILAYLSSLRRGVGLAGSQAGRWVEGLSVEGLARISCLCFIHQPAGCGTGSRCWPYHVQLFCVCMCVCFVFLLSVDSRWEVVPTRDLEKGRGDRRPGSVAAEAWEPRPRKP